ncbi:hypothetical protein O6H91_12G033400 [Diphasiastrum complanatum]|uniref:Uncharacterized protein n=1 Tax=Diphasiastrum complanatum TaxID=34168 RepID=A0ACC2C0Q4_DIPCM|nr:hypothetical protein O6H91_12G033400 [Diphasiastrum complanatum]
MLEVEFLLFQIRSGCLLLLLLPLVMLLLQHPWCCPLLATRRLGWLLPLPVFARRFSTAVASQWPGLPAWRASPLNHNRYWGLQGPAPLPIDSSLPSGTPPIGSLEGPHATKPEARCLAEWGALVLETADPSSKAVLTHQAFQLWCQGKMPIGFGKAPDMPARPVKPELVHPRKIPHPKASALPPNAHMLHNLAHIELNAIDLAWDTVVRFSYASSQLGTQFFADFAHVADDESRHLCWCLQRLSELGFRYGDMPAHNLLWRDCHKTSEHVDARLAIIPMVQEARGLDAGPRLVERLIGLDDNRSAGIVQCISEEEVAHVAVGVSWFYRVCSQQGIEPSLRFKDLMISNGVTLKGPFNYAARTMAGIPRDWFTKDWLKLLLQKAKTMKHNISSTWTWTPWHDTMIH